MKFNIGDVIKHKHEPKIYLIREYDSESLDYIMKPLYPIPSTREYVVRLDATQIDHYWERIIKGN